MSVSFHALLSGSDRPIGNEVADRPNFNNGSAVAVLLALGLLRSDGDLWSCPPVAITEFRRACMRGLSIDRRANAQEVAPWEQERAWCAGIDAATIRDRIAQLASWAAAMSAANATRIYWG